MHVSMNSRDFGNTIYEHNRDQNALNVTFNYYEDIPKNLRTIPKFFKDINI